MKNRERRVSGTGRCIAVLSAVLTVMILFSSSAAAAGEESGKKVIRLFETSDIHGYLIDISSGEKETFQYRLAYIAQCVNSARTSGEYDDVLLVDGGDIYQGAPVSNLQYGAGLRAAMDKMGYDAVVLGNHEFDWGVTEFCADPDGTVPAYALAEYSGDPDTPLLASNLYDAATGERVGFTRDYTVVEKAGLRIALVGYIPDYSGSIRRERIAPYSIDGSLSRLKERVKEINEKEKPDATIILAHETPEPVAAAMDPAEVLLVTGGHLHQGISGVADSGIPYIQSDCYAKGYASAVLTYDTATGVFTVSDPVYTNIVGGETEERLYDKPENAPYLDPGIMSISRAAWTAVGAGMGEVLGYIDSPVEKFGYDGAEGDNLATTGGNFITGLMLAATKEHGTEAAFYNRGGVRADLTIPEGESRRSVTVGDIYAINPFGNKWLIFDLTGAELEKQLRDGLRQSSFGNQISGLSFTYYQLGARDEDSVFYIDSITMSDGRKVDVSDKTTTYRICISDYSSTVPGSVCIGKEPLVPEQDAPADYLALIDYLRENKKQGDGYIPIDNSARAVKLPVCGLHGDVAEDAPYHAAVDYVMENGLMIGVSRNRFAQLDKVSRAMAVTALYRLAGKPETESKAPFSDVNEGSWYFEAASWAAENGIGAGAEDGVFGADSPVTREQLVTLLWEYSGKPDAELSTSDPGAEFAAMSPEARTAYAWAAALGIVRDAADAQKEATRAELAAMLLRLSDPGAAPAEAQPSPSLRKIIIDTDTGADDASALILAAKAENVEILGVTTLVGNVDLEQSTRNAMAALEIAGCGAPVYRGAASTYTGKVIDAFSVFGSDGMGDADLIHPAGKAQEKDAVSFIIDTVRENPGEVELVVLGPATNIALAIQQAPEVMKQVKMIWSMGTAGLGPGNASPVAEFNVCHDPDAYKIMLDFGVPVTVIGLDVCAGDAMWTSAQFEELAQINGIGSFVTDSFGKIREFYASNGSADATMNCDALAMLCVLDPDFVKSCIRTHGSCITAEGETYGQVIFYQEGFTYDVVANDFDHNVILVTDVTEESYFTDFTEAIRR